MRIDIVVAALAASIVGALPALADPIFVWRPSEGLNGGQILPATAFTSTPPVSGAVDFRSEDYDSIPSYVTRTVALAVGDIFSVPIPSVFQPTDCGVSTDDNNRLPDRWVSESIAGGGGKYNVAIYAKASGRLELTVRCVGHAGGPAATLYHEYLKLTIS